MLHRPAAVGGDRSGDGDRAGAPGVPAAWIRCRDLSALPATRAATGRHLRDAHPGEQRGRSAVCEGAWVRRSGDVPAARRHDSFCRTTVGRVTMRFSINIPNFGDFADAHTVARVAAAAEEAGWDGLFLWDHVVHSKEQRRGQPFGDPWMLMTGAALATSRITLGPLVTPVARRRPEQLARQVATLDSMSNGRVIFGAGLGGPIADEFGSFGDTTDPKVLAERLDEGLDLLAAYWAGERVKHTGKHYRVDDVE